MEQTRRLPPVTLRRLDAIVLAGGAGRRLGGIDKCGVEVAGRSLLRWALDAVADAERTVVVGPDRGLTPSVLSAREEPAGAGPVAAIAAGVRRLADAPDVAESPAARVAVVACDMPRVDRTAVHRLAAELETASADVAVYVDDTGRRQHFPAVFGGVRLAAALNELGPPAGAAVHHLLSRLTVVELAADPGVTADCDTWDEVETSRRAMEGR